MKRRLVAIGDSMTQGFQHLAIRRAEWSYPAIVARVLDAPFKHADFHAGDDEGGPLLDLEQLCRALSKRFEDKLDFWEVPAAAIAIRGFMSRIEEYWERGLGTEPNGAHAMHDNLAVWGFEVLDALTLSDGVCARNMGTPKDDALAQVPEFGMYRTAQRVFNPLQNARLEELTQLDLVEAIAHHDGIENLVIALGANNVLGTCSQLDLRWSQSADFRKLAHQRNATIWEPEHFIPVYERLVERVKRIKPDRVFLATVPHVTIPPITRGVSPRTRRNNAPPMVDGYFEYYTRFWIWDDDFDPAKDPCFRREDAKTIDRVIDEYNAHIVKTARNNGWHVLDLSLMNDRLAFRRLEGKVEYEFPAGLVNALRKNENTDFRVRPDGTLLLDSRFFRLPDKRPDDEAPSSEWQMAYKGGLVGLDGIHSTTVGYGLVAYELLRVMKDAGVVGADPDALPWPHIVEADTLLTAPPPILRHLQSTLDYLFSKARLDRVLMQLSGYGSQP
jgi:hypothetical protein